MKKLLILILMIATIPFLKVKDTLAETKTNTITADYDFSLSNIENDLYAFGIDDEVTSDEIQEIMLYESNDNKLYLYVYFPNKFIEYYDNLFAANINKNMYEVSFLKANSEKTISKYLINCNVPLTDIRDYELISLQYDLGSINVSKRYIYTTYEDGSKNYTVSSIETRTISDSNMYYYLFGKSIYVGLLTSEKVMYYLAFNVDFPIDRIISIECIYQIHTATVKRNLLLGTTTSPTFTDLKTVSKKVEAKNKNYSSYIDLLGLKLYNATYEWNTISKTDDNETAPKEVKDQYEYLYIFYDGMCSSTYDVVILNMGNIFVDYNTKVYELPVIEEVTTTNITYEHDGVTYNLPVVDDMSKNNGFLDPGIDTSYSGWYQWFTQIIEWITSNPNKVIQYVLYIIGGIICLLLFGFVFQVLSSIILIFRFIVTIPKIIIEAVRFLVYLPKRVICFLFKPKHFDKNGKIDKRSEKNDIRYNIRN